MRRFFAIAGWNDGGGSRGNGACLDDARWFDRISACHQPSWKLSSKRSSKLSRKLPGGPALPLTGIFLLFFVASAGVYAAVPAVHPHNERRRDYKREIEAVEEQWRTAQLAGDVATMDKLMADDYFGISVAGQLNNKTQQLERLQKRTLVLTKIDVSDVKIKLVGRVAIVTSLARIEGMNDGAEMKGMFRYTRVYKRYPDGSWKITNFEVTRVPGEM